MSKDTGTTNPTESTHQSAPEPQIRNRAVYIISVAAELTGVHPQTLRVYERRGLVAPARTGGMSRRYSEADLDRIRLIQELTNDGLNLAGVERVLALRQEVETLRNRLRKAEARLRDEERSLVPIKADRRNVDFPPRR